MPLYTAKIYGPSRANGPSAEFPTIRKCRNYAESYGTTADSCTITDKHGRVIAEHRRDTSKSGTRWFKASI